MLSPSSVVKMMQLKVFRRFIKWKMLTTGKAGDEIISSSSTLPTMLQFNYYCCLISRDDCHEIREHETFDPIMMEILNHFISISISTNPTHQVSPSRDIISDSTSWRLLIRLSNSFHPCPPVEAKHPCRERSDCCVR